MRVVGPMGGAAGFHLGHGRLAGLAELRLIDRHAFVARSAIARGFGTEARHIGAADLAKMSALGLHLRAGRRALILLRHGGGSGGERQ
jgi:hypothetical protein